MTYKLPEGPKIFWAVHPEGLKIWDNGELIATIPPEDFIHMISHLARALQYQRDDDAGQTVQYRER